MPVVGTTPFAYPTIEQVLNLARVHVNDTFAGATGTAGEGRIFTDSAPFILPALNQAILIYQRKLASAGVPTLRKEVVFTSVPQLQSSAGIGQGDPAINQQLSFTGFNDGTVNYATPALPADLVVPNRIWERNTGQALTFSLVGEAPAGLESRFQDFSIGEWEWRGDTIFWNGALVLKDIRLRYTATIQYNTTATTAFATTTIPLADSLDALAYLTAEAFCAARLPAGGTSDLLGKAEAAINEIKKRYVRRQQSVRYKREPYGESGDTFGWFGG